MKNPRRPTVVADKPYTRFSVFSKLRGDPYRKAVLAHAKSLFKKSDPNSVFYKKTRHLRWIPFSIIRPILIRNGYDGLVFHNEGRVIGSIFFQKRGDRLYAFSAHVDEPFRGKGIAKKGAVDFIKYAKGLPDIRQVRFGAGGHEAVERIINALRNKEANLGIKVLHNGWIDLRPRRELTKHFNTAFAEPLGTVGKKRGQM